MCGFEENRLIMSVSGFYVLERPKAMKERIIPPPSNENKVATM